MKGGMLLVNIFLKRCLKSFPCLKLRFMFRGSIDNKISGKPSVVDYCVLRNLERTFFYCVICS